MEDEAVDALAVVSLGGERKKRRFGTLAGKLEVAEDFDAPLPAELQCYFDGETDG